MTEQDELAEWKGPEISSGPGHEPARVTSIRFPLTGLLAVVAVGVALPMLVGGVVLAQHELLRLDDRFFSGSGHRCGARDRVYHPTRRGSDPRYRHPGRRCGSHFHHRFTLLLHIDLADLTGLGATADLLIQSDYSQGSVALLAS